MVKLIINHFISLDTINEENTEDQGLTTLGKESLLGIQQENSKLEKFEDSKDQAEIEQAKLDAQMKGLMEIFHFYSRQHIPQNREFDHLKEIMNEVDIGEFNIFCKDFKVDFIF